MDIHPKWLWIPLLCFVCLLRISDFIYTSKRCRSVSADASTCFFSSTKSAKVESIWVSKRVFQLNFDAFSDTALLQTSLPSSPQINLLTSVKSLVRRTSVTYPVSKLIEKQFCVIAPFPSKQDSKWSKRLGLLGLRPRSSFRRGNCVSKWAIKAPLLGWCMRAWAIASGIFEEGFGIILHGQTARSPATSDWG